MAAASLLCISRLSSLVTLPIEKGPKEGGISFFDAVRLIRLPFEGSSTPPLQERRIEALAASCRESLLAHETALPDLCDQLGAIEVQRYLSSLTHEILRIPNSPARPLIIQLDKHAKRATLSSVIPSFLAQDTHENLFQYLLYLRHERRFLIEKHLLDEMGLSPVDFFNRMRAADPEYKRTFREKSWQELSLLTQSSLIDHFVRRALTKIYGLKISSWHPKEPFEIFIETLKTEGPLVVEGQFGRPQYVKDPKKLDWKFEEREVYGWAKGDLKEKSCGLSAHTVLVVGAEKRGAQFFVYYLDPLDESEKQKIYVMTYQSLTERIADLYGFVRYTDAPREIGYAYCRV